MLVSGLPSHYWAVPIRPARLFGEVLQAQVFSAAGVDREDEERCPRSQRFAQVRLVSRQSESEEIESVCRKSRAVEELQGENRRLRERIGEPSSAPNANGKRRMHDFNRYVKMRIGLFRLSFLSHCDPEMHSPARVLSLRRSALTD